MVYFKILPQHLCEGSEINHEVTVTWSLVRDLKPTPFEAVMLTSARNSAQHFPNIYIRSARSDCLTPSKQFQYSIAMIKKWPRARLNVTVITDISLSQLESETDCQVWSQSADNYLNPYRVTKIVINPSSSHSTSFPACNDISQTS
jgi:hypothetical protein